MSKKIIFLLTIFICITFNAYAEQYAERSEVRAYIDYTPIESYLINGYTYISADDLTNYGFLVSYDNDTRRLDISRIRYATPYYSREMWESSTAEKHRAKIETTDIKVFLDGEETDCFYADGKILIMIDSLLKYGEFDWSSTDSYYWRNNVYITIFRHELQEDLNNADNVVETAIDEYTSYIGQVNEDNLPDGIGCSTYVSPVGYSSSEIITLGYFKNGRPDGYVYKTVIRWVSRSYISRDIFFIGETDGTKESKREIVRDNGEIIIKYEPRFGGTILPIYRIDGWTGPENPPDATVYKSGCYFESRYGRAGSHEYIIWGGENKTQTELHSCFSNSDNEYETRYDCFGIIDYYRFDEMKKENPKIKYSTEFIEYDNLQKIFHKGAIHTASETPVVLNSSDDGAVQLVNELTVFINGEEVQFDVKPVIINDRVLVPLRRIFEKLGAEVQWDNEEQSVEAEKGNKRIKLTIGSKEMYINNELYEIDVEPIFKDDRTLVPLRAVAEAFNAEVKWDGNLNRVYITLEEE